MAEPNAAAPQEPAPNEQQNNAPPQGESFASTSRVSEEPRSEFVYSEDGFPSLEQAKSVPCSRTRARCVRMHLSGVPISRFGQQGPTIASLSATQTSQNPGSMSFQTERKHSWSSQIAPQDCLTSQTLLSTELTAIGSAQLQNLAKSVGSNAVNSPLNVGPAGQDQAQAMIAQLLQIIAAQTQNVNALQQMHRILSQGPSTACPSWTASARVIRSPGRFRSRISSGPATCQRGTSTPMRLLP